MMDLQTISEEITRLETQKPSYGTCAKLADLYIVKENLMKKQKGGSSEYANYERSGGRENYENYARGGRGGNSGNYMYDDYNYDYNYNRMMMDEEMGMGGKPPRMSMPSMR